MHILNREKTYCVMNLGCKVNRVESDQYESLFKKKGFTGVDKQIASIVIVNTCTVTSEAEKKARKLARSIVRDNEGAMIIITGCASSIAPEEFSELSENVVVVRKDDMLSFIENVLDGWVPNEGRLYGDEVVSISNRDRVGMKIQDGCDNSCTYCIVCKARGASRSISPDEVLIEARDLANAGVREIMLTGIDLGSYRSEDHDLPRLLDELLIGTEDLCDPQEHPCRFRISSIEPVNITDELIETIKASNGRICAHLHIPLQSGSDRILKAMARKYDMSFYMDRIGYIRSCLPKVSLTTDIIVGFPGESEEDFEQTCSIAREAAFSKIHVFPYSRRKGTAAYSYSGQLSPDVKTERARKLRRISEILRHEDLERRDGDREMFLIQGNGLMMSESYYEQTTDNVRDIGKLIEGRIVARAGLRTD